MALKTGGISARAQTGIVIEVTPARRWVLRATYLLLVIGLAAVNLPDLFNPNFEGRGVITSVLGGIWVMAFLGLRYPAQMIPLLLFEFAWKLVWTLRFGLPQYFSGDRPPTFDVDFYSILPGVVLMLAVIPWRAVYRAFAGLPPLRKFGFDVAAEAKASGISETRLKVLRGFCLLVILVWTKDIATAMLDPAAPRGVFGSMITALYLSVILMFRAPALMIPVLLVEIVWKLIWLVTFGLPKWASGVADPQLTEDLFAVGAMPFIFMLLVPWGYVWRNYVMKPAEPWR